MKPIDVLGFEIPSGNGLDIIHVFWHDAEPSRGSVTVTCYGNAWTAYFGSMGGRTIRQFFAEANTDYLVVKMGISQVIRTSKRNDVYLSRIVEAIKKACSAGESPKARGESQ